MVFSTHLIVGASVAQLFPEHPALAFAAALASHYVSDFIPHWEYELSSSKRNAEGNVEDLESGPKFWRDISLVGTDFLLGLCASLLLASYFFYGNYWLAVIGMIGGALPDIMQFVYFKWRHEPAITLKKLHDFVHTRRRFDRVFLGVIVQMALVALVVFAVHFIHWRS